MLATGCKARPHPSHSTHSPSQSLPRFFGSGQNLVLPMTASGSQRSTLQPPRLGVLTLLCPASAISSLQGSTSSWNPLWVHQHDLEAMPSGGTSALGKQACGSWGGTGTGDRKSEHKTLSYMVDEEGPEAQAILIPPKPQRDAVTHMSKSELEKWAMARSHSDIRALGGGAGVGCLAVLSTSIFLQLTQGGSF